MACNLNEALRSREIAEKKFLAKDIVSARKFALKAQNLYPDLDGISQMIATLNVHISADTVVNGERDWYAILSVNALADEEVVKKQYRKLALMLHPDKNKCVGAEGAFKLISEAWSVLSDKTRRMAYDNKRNIKVTLQRYSQPHGSNGFYNFAYNTSVKTQKYTPSYQVKSNAFWTSCRHCKMRYEYLRVYLNHSLLCPNCHEPFLAVETGNPTNRCPTSVLHPSGYHYQNSNYSSSYDHGRNVFSTENDASTFQQGENHDAFNKSNFHWGTFSRSAGAASATASSIAAAHAAAVVHQTYEKVRRDREEKQAAAKRDKFVQKKNHVLNHSGSIFNRKHPQTSIEEKPIKKRRSISEDYLNCNGSIGIEGKDSLANGNKVLSGTTAFYLERADGVIGDGKNRNIRGEISYLDVQNMLIQNAKLLVQKKLRVFNVD